MGIFYAQDVEALDETRRRRYFQLIRGQQDVKDTIRDLWETLRGWRDLPYRLIRERLREISFRKRELKDKKREIRQLFRT